MSKYCRYIPICLVLLVILCISLLLYIKQTIDNTHIAKYVPLEKEILPFHDYDKNCFWNNRFLKYEDTTYSSLAGIDVSEFQDTIDWKKVKEDGIDFTFLRIGRRGASTGLLYLDQEFEKNYAGAKEQSIPIGVYFFSQAISDKEIDEEVEFVLDNLKGKELNLPVVYDLEEVYLPDETPRANSMTKEEKTARALHFCKKIEEKGYRAMIYTGLYWARDSYDMEQLKDFPIWFAQYGVDYPDLEYPFEIWQYSDSGRVNGVSQPVDMNIMFIRKNDQPE